MKPILPLILIFFISLYGCSNHETDNQIKRFEEVLGKENSETLTYLVNDFENNFLKKKYPNLSVNNAYKEFLAFLGEGGDEYYDIISPKGRKLFEESQLKWELHNYADSVWLENRYIKTTYNIMINGEKVGKTASERSLSNYLNIDSLLAKQKTSYIFNAYGKFFEAIKTVKKGNSLLEDYHHTKDTHGFLSRTLVSSIISRNNVNLDGFFAKRIIVVECAF